jgi:uncharacterized protein YycO
MTLYSKPELEALLAPGDIVLVHGRHLLSRVIRVITQSHWNHAVLYLGEGNFIESRKGGVQITTIDSFVGQDIAVYRHKTATDKQLDQVCVNALSKQGSGYDVKGLFGIAWLFLTLQRGSVRDLDSKNKYLCSELVASAYLSAGLPLSRYPPSQTCPADIDLSPVLQRL